MRHNSLEDFPASVDTSIEAVMKAFLYWWKDLQKGGLLWFTRERTAYDSQAAVYLVVLLYDRLLAVHPDALLLTGRQAWELARPIYEELMASDRWQPGADRNKIRSSNEGK
jgi:hypothetical protein